VIAEFGPGEGCHTREIVRRMHPQSRLMLFELDAELCDHLRKHFRHDHRVEVLNADAADLPSSWKSAAFLIATTWFPASLSAFLSQPRRSSFCRTSTTRSPPRRNRAFIIYQVTNELRAHTKIFPRLESEYCLQNIPPMFVIKFYKQALMGAATGMAMATENGKHHHHANGNGATSTERVVF